VLPGGAAVQRLFEVAGVTELVPFRTASKEADRGHGPPLGMSGGEPVTVWVELDR
jgi:hypothetical protein